MFSNMPNINMNFSYDANIQSYPHIINYSWLGPFDVGPSDIGPSTISVGPFMLPPLSVQNESDDDDTDDNIVQPESRMHIVAKENKNGIGWVDIAYANNEYVPLEDPHPDEFEGENWVDMTVVENTTTEHTRCVSHTVSTHRGG